MAIDKFNIKSISTTKLCDIIDAAYNSDIDKKEILALDQIKIWLNEKYFAEYNDKGYFCFPNREKYTEFVLTWM